jgi:hypothetical protein
VIARISLWQAIGVVIYMGAGIALLLLLMTYPAILDRLDRRADKRATGCRTCADTGYFWGDPGWEPCSHGSDKRSEDE